jgi:hypothetical protein
MFYLSIKQYFSFKPKTFHPRLHRLMTDVMAKPIRIPILSDTNDPVKINSWKLRLAMLAGGSKTSWGKNEFQGKSNDTEKDMDFAIDLIDSFKEGSTLRNRMETYHESLAQDAKGADAAGYKVLLKVLAEAGRTTDAVDTAYSTLIHLFMEFGRKSGEHLDAYVERIITAFNACTVAKALLAGDAAEVVAAADQLIRAIIVEGVHCPDFRKIIKDMDSKDKVLTAAVSESIGHRNNNGPPRIEASSEYANLGAGAATAGAAFLSNETAANICIRYNLGAKFLTHKGCTSPSCKFAHVLELCTAHEHGECTDRDCWRQHREERPAPLPKGSGKGGKGGKGKRSAQAHVAQQQPQQQHGLSIDQMAIASFMEQKAAAIRNSQPPPQQQQQYQQQQPQQQQQTQQYQQQQQQQQQTYYVQPQPPLPQLPPPPQQQQPQQQLPPANNNNITPAELAAINEMMAAEAEADEFCGIAVALSAAAPAASLKPAPASYAAAVSPPHAPTRPATDPTGYTPGARRRRVDVASLDAVARNINKVALPRIFITKSIFISLFLIASYAYIFYTLTSLFHIDTVPATSALHSSFDESAFISALNSPTLPSPDTHVPWIYDSGATSIMTGFKPDLIPNSLTPCSIPINGVNSNAPTSVSHRGSISLSPALTQGNPNYTFSDCFYVSAMNVRLFSVSAAEAFSTTFHSVFHKPDPVTHAAGYFEINGSRTPLFLVNRLYVFYSPKTQNAFIGKPKTQTETPVTDTTTTEHTHTQERLPFSSYTHNLKLVHNRLFHFSERIIRKTLANTIGNPIILPREHLDPCVDCANGMGHHSPLTKHSPHAPRDPTCLLVHTDWWGPYKIPGHTHKERYLQCFIDDASGFTRIYASRNKDCGADNLRHFAALIKEKTNGRCQVTAVQADSETVYKYGEFAKLCTTEGYLQRFSSAYTHQQNGRAERFWRTMEEHCSASLSHSAAPLFLWVYAAQNFTHTHNLMSSSNSDLSPEELLTGVKPDLSGLRTFGCPVHAFMEKHTHSKFENKCLLGINCGPDLTTKDGFHIYFPSKRTVLQTRHIPLFDELWIERSEYYQQKALTRKVIFKPDPPDPPDEFLIIDRGDSRPAPLREATPVQDILPIPIQPTTGLTPGQNEPAPRTDSSRLHRAISHARRMRRANSDPSSSRPRPQSLPVAQVIQPSTSQPPHTHTSVSQNQTHTRRTTRSKNRPPDGPNSNENNSRRTPITIENDRYTVERIIKRGPAPDTFVTEYAKSYNMTAEALRSRLITQPTPFKIRSRPLQSIYNPANFDVEWDPVVEEIDTLSIPSPSGPNPIRQLARFLSDERRSRARNDAGPSTGAYPAFLQSFYSFTNTSTHQHFATLCKAPAQIIQRAYASSPLFIDDPDSPASSSKASPYLFPKIESTLTDKNPEIFCFLDVILPSGETPLNYNQAINSLDAKHWKFALDSEFEQLVDAKTWILVPDTEASNIVSGKWVFRIKKNANGEIERYKARWVARGFSQRAGIDYAEIFSPVVRYSSVRTLISLANALDLELYGLDVSNAFARAKMVDHEIFVKQPIGYSQNDPRTGRPLVCKLQSPLYGTKQASRLWHRHFAAVLLKRGWRQYESDSCIFHRRTSTHGHEFIGLYVDDIIHVCASAAAHTSLHSYLNSAFPTTSQGTLTWILGMEIKRDYSTRTLSLTQTQKVITLLEDAGMRDAVPLSSPIPPQWKYGTSAPITDPERIFQYRSRVGALSHIAICTRPDLAFTVNALCRHLSNPNEKCFTALNHCLRYLAGTPDYGITYHFNRSSTLTLEAYSDSTFGGEDIDNAKSQTGLVFFFGGGPIDWSSHLQKVIALSSAEAEFVAAFTAAKSIVYFRQLLEEFGQTTNGSTTIWCDNTSAIAQSKNPVKANATRHVRIRYHYLRDLSESNIVRLQYVKTIDQLADIFTKPLDPKTFLRLRDFIVQPTSDVKTSSFRPAAIHLPQLPQVLPSIAAAA